MLLPYERSSQLGLVGADLIIPVAGLVEAEILILRHQLNIQRRHLPKRLNFNTMDRLIFVALYRLLPGTLNALTLVKPDTVYRKLCPS